MIMKRVLMLSMIAASLGVSGQANAHQCLRIEVRSVARADTTTEGLSVAMLETQLTEMCGGEEATVNETSGSFTVLRDGEAICHRSDVDPSFDPFGFGAGLHMEADDEGDCAIGITWVSLGPNLPMPEESGPEGLGVGVAVGKNAPAEGDLVTEENPNRIPGLRLRTEEGFELHSVLDPDAVVFRKVVVTPVFD